jgi:hypothetical protein
MTIPAELLTRLVILDETPADYEEVYMQQGLDFLKRYIDRLEQKDFLFRQWVPQLNAFCVSCRASDNFTDLETLDKRNSAKILIYEAKIAEMENLGSRTKRNITFCCIQHLGIPIAQRLWPGKDKCSIILTPEELIQWHNIYKHPKDAVEWWTNYWWEIDDSPDASAVRYRDWDLTVPIGTSPWIVISGQCSGALSGTSDIELWAWNEEVAIFVRPLYSLTF